MRAAATGLQIGARDGLTDRTGYVAMLGVVGRESYIIDSSDPRYVSELLQGPLSNSGAFGSGMWTARYANIRNANLLLAALENVEGLQRGGDGGHPRLGQDLPGARLPPGDQHARRERRADRRGGRRERAGPVRQQGGRVRAHRGPAGPGPHHLQAGGSDFPFSIGSGLADFSTPQTFLQLNRALRARVAVYMGDYAGAITLFPQTFLDTSDDLDAGAYHTYASSEGQGNDLANEFNYARPALVTDAETQAGSTDVDQRVLDKIGPHDSPRRSRACRRTRSSCCTPMPRPTCR